VKAIYRFKEKSPVGNERGGELTLHEKEDGFAGRFISERDSRQLLSTQTIEKQIFIITHVIDICLG
jgi:hypothetical protein